MWDVIAVIETSGPLELVEASGGGMDWSSFWPDMIVAALTTGAIAALVLFAERRISNRSREREVADAQSAVVDRARTLLRHEIRWQGERNAVLHADESLLERLVEAVQAVPSGRPSEHVPGYTWAKATADSAVEVESLADALDGRIADYSTIAGPTAFLDGWVKANVKELSELAPAEAREWRWRWWENTQTVATRKLEADSSFRALVDQYVHQRRLLIANRAAFLATVEYLQTEEREARMDVARVRGAKRNWRRARREATSRVAASRVWADTKGDEIVARVGPAPST